MNLWRAAQGVMGVLDLQEKNSFMGTLALYSLFLKAGSIATDSRNIKPGAIFFALKGDNHDGNKFALDAIKSGASIAVVDDKSLEFNHKFIFVDDVLKTLQELAKLHRKKLGIKVVGLTGTNGKTTTKELISAVLSTKFKIYATKGNFNNHIGVPLSILEIDNSIEIAVMEMGASAKGEIETLVNIVAPDCGLITNVGRAHLLGFGSFEGVKEAKGELYDFLKLNKSSIFVNTDNQILLEMLRERGIKEYISYGINNEEYKILETNEENPFLRLVDREGLLVESNLIGGYNSDNIAAAIAVGRYFGIDIKDAIEGIKSYIPTNNRSQLVKSKRNVLIVDAYNANPSSMKVAIENFGSFSAQKRILILGDMLELGLESQNEHKGVLSLIDTQTMESLYFVGKEFKEAAKEFPNILEISQFYSNSTELRDSLEKENLSGFTILIKGSRGTRLEKSLDVL